MKKRALHATIDPDLIASDIDMRNSRAVKEIQNQIDTEVINYVIKIGELTHRLDRYKERLSLLRKKFNNREMELTYHAGYDVGYIDGKISEIESRIEELENE